MRATTTTTIIIFFNIKLSNATHYSNENLFDLPIVYASFAINLYSQCCRRHVVRQQVVSEVSVVRSCCAVQSAHYSMSDSNCKMIRYDTISKYLGCIQKFNVYATYKHDVKN